MKTLNNKTVEVKENKGYGKVIIITSNTTNNYGKVIKFK